MIRKLNVLSFILCCCTVACNNTSTEQPEGVRIVSLSPGITATVVDIGYGDFVVGRSSFCSAVDQDIPVVGDLLQVDYERLLRLAPSDVFVQTTSAGKDSLLSTLADDGHFVLHSWRVDRLSDIKLLYRELSILLHGQEKQLEISFDQEGDQESQTILIMTTGSDGNAGLCFGRQTYLGDLLELMGTQNALQSDGWVMLSLEDIGKLQPELIVVVSDIAIPESSLVAINSLQIPIAPFVHSDALIPSSKIVDVANALQQLVSVE
jgi:ABC-type hemin transport system substrate-binding protein